jgi:hypothetical protein
MTVDGLIVDGLIGLAITVFALAMIYRRRHGIPPKPATPPPAGGPLPSQAAQRATGQDTAPAGGPLIPTRV